LSRLGVIHASRDNATKALRSGAVVLVFPGGDYDAFRPTRSQNVIDFDGRTGYVRTAMTGTGLIHFQPDDRAAAATQHVSR
jgi:hypothetical protein